MMHFCWLPPLRLVIGGVDAGRLHAELLDDARGHLRFAAAIDQAGRARLRRSVQSVMFSPTVICGEQAEPLAIFGHQRDAGAHRLRPDGETRRRWPSSRIAPVRRVGTAPNRHSSSSVRPAPIRPAMPRISPRRS